jgi:cell division control protein 45
LKHGGSFETFNESSLYSTFYHSFHTQEYNLGNCEYSSFFRVTGYQSLLSASDTSYAVTALLECETSASLAPGLEEKVDEEKEMIEAFNIAFDALNPNKAPSTSITGLSSEGRDASSLVNGGNLSGNTGIGAGIRLAMSLQKNIIQTAVNLGDRGDIGVLRHFRYAYLNCTSAGENQTARSDLVRSSSPKTSNDETKHHIFSKPLALCRLAHFMMDMNRENGKWAGGKSRPLVLLAEKPLTKSYLVVGYEYPERAGNFIKNRFGKNFDLTARSMNGTFKFDSFDSNVVEVGGDDVQRFIEQLHYLMDSI